MPKAKGERCCRAPGCNKTESHRGLCLVHYSEAKKLVAANKTTWEELEALELVASTTPLLLREIERRRKEKE